MNMTMFYQTMPNVANQKTSHAYKPVVPVKNRDTMMLASLKSEDSNAQLQLVEREDVENEEDLFEAIDKLIS